MVLNSNKSFLTMNIYTTVIILHVFVHPICFGAVTNTATDDGSWLTNEDSSCGFTQKYPIANIGLSESTAYAFVGEELNFTCTLPEEVLSKNCTSDDIRFQIMKFDEYLTPTVCLNKTLPVNTSTALLNVRNIDLNYSNTEFKCYVSKSGTCGDDRFFARFKDLKVQNPPHNVTNFTCVIYNWIDHMNCSWRHPVRYPSDDEPGVDIIMTVELHALNIFINPSLESWHWPKDSFKARDTYDITVVVTNTVTQTSARKMFTVVAEDIVEPAPVTNLSAVALAGPERCIHLVWHQSSEKKTMHRISQQIFGDSDFKVLASNISAHSFTICNSVPSTLYNFSVDCKTSSLRGYWSKKVFFRNFSNPEFAPSEGPLVVEGGYTTSICNRGSRIVTVFWQEVDNSSTNGVIRFYSIKRTDQLLGNVTAARHNVTVALECADSPITITISAHNGAGESVKPSVLSIAPATFSVPFKIRETFHVMWYRKNNMFTAIWDSLYPNMVNTVFWKNERDNFVRHKVISPGEMIASRMTLRNPEEFMYGIASTGVHSGWTSGIYWSRAIYFADPDKIICHEDPYTVIKGVESAKIVWQKMECPYVKVTEILIEYCELINCNVPSSIKRHIVPLNASNVTLTSLKPNIQYRVNLYVNSKPVADGHIVTPLEGEDTTTPMVITVALLCSGVLIVVFAVLFIRSCVRSKKRAAQLTSTEPIKE